MPESIARRALPVPANVWIRPLAPAMRFILQGGPEARAAAARAWEAAFSDQRCRAMTKDSSATLWLGPDEYLLLKTLADSGAGGDDPGAATAAGQALEEALAGVPHSLVDIGHRQFACEVTGPHAAEILNGACPLDLDLGEFPPGMCTRTVLAKADIVLWRTRADAFHLEVWRSFGSYVIALLAEIASEFYGPTLPDSSRSGEQ